MGANLDARIAIAEEDLKGIPERTRMTARLENNVDIRRNIRARVESDLALAQMAEGSSIPDVSVMVRAVEPLVPSSAPQSRVLYMTVLVSLAVAVALAILLDKLDRRLRYRQQVTGDLGLLVLGAVPRSGRIRSWQKDSLNAARIVEAFRSIRLALTQAFEPGQPITVALSSPGQGEGKSLVSENLALAFADGGYKTLLIDGDTRRGELHATFGVERRGGLLDHLAGRIPLNQAVRETATANLWILPSGTRFKRGPELLMTPAMHPLFEELRARFDVIIIDTPPLSAGVDAFVFATTVGTMVLVLRNGKTDRKLAEAKLDLMDRLPVRVLGAVINDVRGTSGYDHYAYIDAYGTEEEDDTIPEESPSLAERPSDRTLVRTED
jgi:capsular exopolysaccharide synthesis family protein